jgi:hypothetical protein
MIRASQIHRLRTCPGSLAAEAGLPEQTNIYSESGTRMHKMMETNNFDGATPEELQTLTDIVRMGADVEQDIMGECKRPLKVYKETELFITNARGEKKVSNHPDKIVVGEHSTHGWFGLVLDTKTGHGEVDSAESNDQVMSYSVAANQCLPFPFAKLFGRILQRFASHNTVEYDAVTIEQAKDSILAVVAEAEKPNAKRVPSESACKYCKAIGTSRCPETQFAIETSMHEINQATLTPEDMARRLEVFSLAEKIIDKERAIYKQMLVDTPGCIPGWEIKPGQIMRSIEDLAGAHRALYNSLDLEDHPEVWQECLKASVPTVQSALQSARGISELAANKLLSELLGPLLIEKPKAGSLSPISKKALKGKM